MRIKVALSIIIISSKSVLKSYFIAFQVFINELYSIILLYCISQPLISLLKSLNQAKRHNFLSTCTITCAITQLLLDEL